MSYLNLAVNPSEVRSLVEESADLAQGPDGDCRYALIHDYQVSGPTLVISKSHNSK